jgi:hypothetical protein
MKVLSFLPAPVGGGDQIPVESHRALILFHMLGCGSAQENNVKSTPAPGKGFSTREADKPEFELVDEEGLNPLVTREPSWRELRDYRRYRLSRK